MSPTLRAPSDARFGFGKILNYSTTNRSEYREYKSSLLLRQHMCHSLFVHEEENPFADISTSRQVRPAVIILARKLVQNRPVKDAQFRSGGDCACCL
ncbi:hypothetical protein ABIE64_002116 [Thalassospira sp. MBR-102]